MNRSVSLSDHARRRKARQGHREFREDGSASSDSFERDASGFEDGFGDGGGGVAHDAARFGAYDAPAPSRLRGGAAPGSGGRGEAMDKLFDGEHASYAAERCIGFDGEGHQAGGSGGSGGRVPPPQRHLTPQRGIVAPGRGASFSSPEMDMEASYYHVRNGSRARYGDSYCGSVAAGPIVGGMGGASSVAGTSYSNGSSYNNGSYVSNASSDSSFVSVDVSSTMGSDMGGSRFDASTVVTGSTLDPREEEQDAIRAGIRDISVFVATYLAGGLSLVLGIFLALLSPFIKIIKVIFGDLTGLIGDAFGLALRNNPGLVRDLKGLTRIFKGFASPSSPYGASRGNAWGHRRRGSDENLQYESGMEADCEASVGGVSAYTAATNTSSQYSHWDARSEDSTVYTTAEPQYVGGWTPSVISGGSSNYSAHHSPIVQRQGMHPPSMAGRHLRPPSNHPRSRSSKSYSSLPQVIEDDSSSCPPSYPQQNYYPDDDSSVMTSLSATSYNSRECRDNRRLMQRMPRTSRSGRRGSNGY